MRIQRDRWRIQKNQKRQDFSNRRTWPVSSIAKVKPDKEQKCPLDLAIRSLLLGGIQRREWK